MSSWSKYSGAIEPWRPRREAAHHAPDVDDLWEGMRATVAGLQAAGRLPADAYIFDSRHDVLIDYLKAGELRQASAQARRIAEGEPPGLFALTAPKRNPAGGFVAYELL